MTPEENIIQVQDLCVNLMTTGGIVYAVQGVSMDIKKGEIHGIVGESGCGKSVSMKAILRLHDDEKTEYSGKILFSSRDGVADILQLKEKEMQMLRGKSISMIFQDPMVSLNPTMRVGEQVAEQLREKLHMSKQESREKTLRLFEETGILPAQRRYDQYPFELSGGLLQRIMIVMAISCEPELLIADEPTTALDVTIQIQILNLIKEIQEKNHTSVILITHDLGVVAEICDTVTVMYAGKIVESGRTVEIFDDPCHPYTRALMNSNPRDSDTDEYMRTIPGAPPLLYERFEGCPFAARCELAEEKCRQCLPQTMKIGETHFVACFAAMRKRGDVNG